MALVPRTPIHGTDLDNTAIEHRNQVAAARALRRGTRGVGWRVRSRAAERGGEEEATAAAAAAGAEACTT